MPVDVGARNVSTVLAAVGRDSVRVAAGAAVSTQSDRPITVAACAPLTNVTDYVSPHGADQIVLIGGELVVEDEPECNVGNDPGAAVAVFKADLPTV